MPDREPRPGFAGVLVVLLLLALAGCETEPKTIQDVQAELAPMEAEALACAERVAAHYAKAYESLRPVLIKVDDLCGGKLAPIRSALFSLHVEKRERQRYLAALRQRLDETAAQSAVASRRASGAAE